MTKLSLSNVGIRRCMTLSYARGVDPYNSADAYKARAARMIADKARRYRDPYPMHREF